MDWITTEIAIGNYLEAGDIALLAAHGFRSVLSLDGSLSPSRAAELGLNEIVTVRLEDGPGNLTQTFRRAVVSLQQLVQTRSPVLVHCHAGRSRSPVVVAGYLMETLRIEPAEAIAQVAAKREINISQGLEELLFRL